MTEGSPLWFTQAPPCPKNRFRIRSTDVRLGGGPVRAETRQRLSEAVWGAFGDQGSVYAHRRPDPHSTVGGAATASFSCSTSSLSKAVSRPPAFGS
jgi:hypothetical protein